MAYVGISFRAKNDMNVRIKLHGPTDNFNVDLLVLTHEVLDSILDGDLPIDKNELLGVCRVVSDQVIEKYGDGESILWSEVEIGNVVTGVCVGASAEKVLVG